jgi:Sulfite exporter TauE/SafE
LIGKVLPDWLLVISLVILLAHTTWTTLTKAKSQYDKETAAMEKATKSALVQTIEKEVEMAEQVGLLAVEEDGKGAGLEITSENIELAQLLEDDKRTPFDKVVILSVMVVVTCGLNILKGGGGHFPSPLGIKCGSDAYWGLTGLTLVWILAISLWMRSVLIEKWKLKARVHYKYLPGDVEWNERNTIIYPCICFFAGFFAGMFGVGGGIVKGPLMLQMGVHPLVASGTVAVMIMFTSVAATAMFIAFGTLIWDYAWFLFVVGLITTTVGQFGVSYYVDKYKRYSYISMSIGAVVAISTVLMGVQSVFSLVDAQTSGKSSTSSLCG